MKTTIMILSLFLAFACSKGGGGNKGTDCQQTNTCVEKISYTQPVLRDLEIDIDVDVDFPDNRIEVLSSAWAERSWSDQKGSGVCSIDINAGSRLKFKLNDNKMKLKIGKRTFNLQTKKLGRAIDGTWTFDQEFNGVQMTGTVTIVNDERLKFSANCKNAKSKI